MRLDLRTPIRATLATLAAVLVTSIAACEYTLYPADAEPLEPGAKYAVMWRTVEWCAGKRGDLGAIAWFVTDVPARTANDDDVSGSWWISKNHVYLTRAYAEDESVIRHQMLHALLRRKHHTEEFIGSCGDIVACYLECQRQAGGPPPRPPFPAPFVPSDTLEVETHAIEPRLADSGWVAIVVSARNPTTIGTWLPVNEAAGLGFHCSIAGTMSCGVRPVLTGYEMFAQGTTRRATYMTQLPPGRWLVDAGFSANRPPQVLVKVD
jgi:hypothetical protein